MTKYILQLLSLFNISSAATSPQPKITAAKPRMLMQLMERRNAAIQTAIQTPTTPVHITAPEKPHVQITQSQPTTSAPQPTAPKNPNPGAKPTKQVSLAHILNELDKYVDCAFSCIKCFLSEKDHRKLACFAKDIDACVRNLEEKVLKPLESMKADANAAHLHHLAVVLKNNQCQFKSKITGGYNNAMSLGMALLNLKSKATKDVTKALEHVTPCLSQSELAAQFTPLKNKIVALTNYGIDPMRAMKVLGKRF